MKIEEAIKELNDCLKSNKNCLWCPNDKTLTFVNLSKHPALISDPSVMTTVTAPDVTLVIEALEKQIPKLVDMSHCNCGMALDNVWKYCPNCGQALKWGGATDGDTSTD